MTQAREAWIETLDANINPSQVGLMNLHPDVFSVYPRLDIIHQNVTWQLKYRTVVGTMFSVLLCFAGKVPTIV